MTLHFGLNLQQPALRETHFGRFEKNRVIPKDRVLYYIFENTEDLAGKTLSTAALSIKTGQEKNAVRVALNELFTKAHIIEEQRKKNPRNIRDPILSTFKSAEEIQADLEHYAERIKLVEQEKERIRKLRAQAKLSQAIVPTTAYKESKLSFLGRSFYEEHDWNPCHPLGLTREEKAFTRSLYANQKLEPNAENVTLSEDKQEKLRLKFALYGKQEMRTFFTRFYKLYDTPKTSEQEIRKTSVQIANLLKGTPFEAWALAEQDAGEREGSYHRASAGYWMRHFDPERQIIQTKPLNLLA